MALLPALLYRAAIPAGFMPMVEDGRMVLMFCPGEVATRPLNDPHAAHHHHHDSDRSKPASVQHAPCPFAASAGPAPLPVAAAISSPPPKPGHVPAQIIAQFFSPAVVRAQAARAPPFAPNY